MSTSPTDSRQTQRGRILALFIDAKGAEVSLPEILALGIAQFGARLLELRGLGFHIVNRQEVVDGERRSWYRLLAGPTPPPVAGGSLFGDLSLEQRHRR